MSFILLLYY